MSTVAHVGDDPDLDSSIDLALSDPASPRMVIASDSTASEYSPDRAPRMGWGQHLAAHTGHEVHNLAISGASSRSFIELGALDRACELLRAGDLLLVAFGHNDAKPDERHSSLGGEYQANLRRYIAGAHARGARPVLMTPVERREFVGGSAQHTHGGYPQEVRALAEAEDVPLIDLTVHTRAAWQDLGEEASKDAFLWLEPGQWPGYPEGEQDDTHFSAFGADLVAQVVASELRRLTLI